MTRLRTRLPASRGTGRSPGGHVWRGPGVKSSESELREPLCLPWITAFIQTHLECFIKNSLRAFRSWGGPLCGPWLCPLPHPALVQGRSGPYERGSRFLTRSVVFSRRAHHLLQRFPSDSLEALLRRFSRRGYVFTSRRNQRGEGTACQQPF